MKISFRSFIAALLAVAAVLVVYFQHERGRVRQLNFAAGPRDGEAFQLAEAIAEVTERYNTRIQITVLETRGSGHNMRLLQQGRVQLAAVLADSRPVQAARLVAPLYPDAFQLVAREDSGIESVADLRGHKIALPPRGAGQFDSFWFLADHYGLAASEFEALPMSTDAANFAMSAGAVDAVFRVRAPGNTSIQELIEGSPTHLVAIDQAAAMRLKQPAIELGTIPKGSYRGHPPLPMGDLETAEVQRLLIASNRVEPAIVSTITRVLFERRRDLVNLTPLAGFISAPDRATGTFMPVHAGAQRYYNREKPSFLQENAEPIAVFLSLIVLLGSGLLRVTSQRRKGRLDSYNHELLVLYAEARGAGDRRSLLKQRDKLMGVLGRVVDDAEEGRITAEGFNVFSFTWDAVNEEVRDRLKGGGLGGRALGEDGHGRGRGGSGGDSPSGSPEAGN